MNIDTLIEQLINAKSKGAERVDIVDQNWYDYAIDAVAFNEDADEKAVVIQVSSEW
jgi:hypothetical protein